MMKKFSKQAKHTMIVTALAALGIVGVALAFSGNAHAGPFLGSPITHMATPATPTGGNLPLVGSLPTHGAVPSYATRGYLASSLAAAIALPSAPILTHGAWMGGSMGEFGGHVGLGFVAATALPHHLTGSIAISSTPSNPFNLGTPAVRLEIGGSFGNWG
jgi:hypothetical protein